MIVIQMLHCYRKSHCLQWLIPKSSQINYNIRGEVMDGLTAVQVATITENVVASLDKKEKRSKKERRDHRLRNTYLLLDNYRKLKSHVDTQPEVSDEQREYERETGDEITLNSLMKYHIKTEQFLSFIDSILAGFEFQAKNGDEAAWRRFRVIEFLYLSTTHLSVSEIAIYFNCDVSTIHKDKRRAVNDLSVMLYGIDAISDFLSNGHFAP